MDYDINRQATNNFIAILQLYECYLEKVNSSAEVNSTLI